MIVTDKLSGPVDTPAAGSSTSVPRNRFVHREETNFIVSIKSLPPVPTFAAFLLTVRRTAPVSLSVSISDNDRDDGSMYIRAFCQVVPVALSDNDAGDVLVPGTE